MAHANSMLQRGEHERDDRDKAKDAGGGKSGGGASPEQASAAAGALKGAAKPGMAAMGARALHGAVGNAAAAKALKGGGAPANDAEAAQAKHAGKAAENGGGAPEHAHHGAPHGGKNDKAPDGAEKAADGKPALPGMPAADMSGSLMAFAGVLMALLRQRETGQGDFVDIALHDSVLAWTPNYCGPAFAENRPHDVPMERNWGGAAFYNVYETADGMHLVLGGMEPHFCHAVLGKIGRAHV